MLDPLIPANGPPAVTGSIRSAPEDFLVDESLSFTPAGAGDHVFLRLRKRLLNTEQAAGRLARLAGLANRDVGYAGLKDRQAVAVQWFSVALGARPEPDWSRLEDDRLAVVEVARHNRKLRRGAIRGNRFEITVRDLRGDLAGLERRLQSVRAAGFPNYFGAQRFGSDNLEQARALFERRIRPDRHRRGLYLSAARALLFNRVLARRVAAGCWNRALAGDALMLEGTHSFFLAETLDETIEGRIAAGDLHPSGPLWGRGPLATSGAARELESAALADCEPWCRGLEENGLEQQRRALRACPRDMSWDLDPGAACLSLRFTLPAGSYATVLLGEVVSCGASGLSAL